GVEDGRITGAQMTASSHKSPSSTPSLARLNNKHIHMVTHGCWWAGVNNIDQWLQIDIGRVVTVSVVATQGNDGIDWWVASYTLGYSLDGTVWSVYQENSVDKLFPGNVDRLSIAFNVLSSPVKAKLIRFQPKGWNLEISLRVEIYQGRTVR
ncbi:predicted protein, partial [Nematostella vectensis]